MATVTNIAAYKFAPLRELRPLRERLLALCRGWNLRGTILLSPEGINLFVAGGREEIEKLLTELRSVPGLEDLTPKYSESAKQPFNRMLVRLKKEIIAFGVDGISPGEYTSPKISPTELKRWLDEGRPVTLLDTRNDYEVKLGTFKGATTLPIRRFRDFPEAVRSLPESLKQQPIVMFCTGGIRCEKAGPFMEREGFTQVWQLDGGILKYFEETGGAHYEGECFVFDQRVGVDAALHETDATVCFACQTPLTAEEQQDPRYMPPHSCPYCFKTTAEEQARRLAQRHEQLRQLITPLPGSVPEDNYRPLKVPAEAEGKTLVACLQEVFPHQPAEKWEVECRQGHWVDARRQPVAVDHVVSAGEIYYHREPAAVEPEVAAEFRVLYEDEALLVLNKPAPLPMHPCGRYHRNTLEYLLRRLYAPQRPRPAHRLDANTTGLVACARTRYFARRLQPQFEAGTVEKTYLVHAAGAPAEQFVCDTPIPSARGPLGTRTAGEGDEPALPAQTEFRRLKRLPDGTAILEARPLTGRTNQIRIHLWQRGIPVLGDPAYLQDGQIGSCQTIRVDAPPMRLHAWKLSFLHPLTGQRVHFEAPLPAWAEVALA